MSEAATLGARALPAREEAHRVDWPRVASLVHMSRALDDLEEKRLLPERKVL
jgi:2-oxoisovalerate dehydrogenase E1 component